MGRKEWLEARRKGLGGSDIAAILGISPWATEMDVYLDKLGLSKDKDTNAKQRGRFLEKAVAEWYAEKNGVELAQAGHFQGRADFMLGTPDFWVNVPGEAERWGLECKTSRSDSGWGKEMTDDIPAYYKTQCHWYMLVTEQEVWDVAVYFTMKDEFKQYRLIKDADLHSDMLDAAAQWWTKHIIDGIPPEVDGSRASDTFLQFNFPEDDGAIREPSPHEVELMEELHTVNAGLKGLQERKSYIVNFIKEQMGESTVLLNDRLKASWKLGKGRKTFDSKAFRKDHPDLAEQYTRTSEPSRAFRFTYNEE